MSINLILLLAANGVRLTNSHPRFIETLSSGKPITVLDQERNQFSLTKSAAQAPGFIHGV